MRPLIHICLLFLLTAAEVFAQAPTITDTQALTITDIKPKKSGAVGDTVAIEGTGFGDKQDSSTVKFGDKPASPEKWTDKSIIVSVPAGAGPGDVVITVTVTGKSANTHFEVTPPKYDQTHFEVLTGIGAVLAGVESTSYKVDVSNNALSATNVGRKQVELLLGGGFIMPWRRGGAWIEDSFCTSNDWRVRAKADIGQAKKGDPNAKIGKSEQKKIIKAAKEYAREQDCRPGGDPAYKRYRPWEAFLSIRFAPSSEQTISGFVLGGGYRITKYFSVLVGYSVTPFEEPSPGFRVAAAQIVSANPTISPYNRYTTSDLLQNKPGAFDGFPLFVYNASGVTTTKLFPTSPTLTHHRSGIYFGVGIPLNLTALFKPTGK